MMPDNQRSSTIVVSQKREAWRERVILNRASGLVRNRDAYLRKALPEFINGETHEICQWLVGRLVEFIDRKHPLIEDMKTFVRREAHSNDLPVQEDWIESVIELAYFKWKVTVSHGHLQNGDCRRTTPRPKPFT